MTRIFLLFVSLVLFACASPTKMLEKGQNDRAFNQYVRQLSGKKSLPKTADVQGLETAFRRANEFDLAIADSLRSNGGEALWPTINALDRNIQARQRVLRPLLPVQSKEGYTAQFSFVEKIDSLESESRERAAEHLYNMAEFTLAQARSYNRLSAREAYGYLSDLKKNYFSDWRDTEALLAEALELGTTRFLVTEQGTGYYASQFFTTLRSQGAITNTPSFWHTFDFQEQSNRQYDYVIYLQLNNIFSGSENRTESNTTVTKDLEIRVDVVKDSSGNVIERTPVYEKISATITEVRIEKDAWASLYVQVVDLQTGAEVAGDNLEIFNNFDQTWVTISGDERALDSKPFCTGFGIPSAPSDWSMIWDLAYTMKGRLGRFWWTYGENL